MPSLLIRKLDEALHKQLKRQAVENNRSLEDEARELLRHAVVTRKTKRSRETIVDIADRIFGPLGGVHLDIPPRGSDGEREPPDFSGPEYDR